VPRPYQSQTVDETGESCYHKHGKGRASGGGFGVYSLTHIEPLFPKRDLCQKTAAHGESGSFCLVEG